MDLVTVQSSSGHVRTRHWPFFGDCGNIRGQYREKRTKGLYQWITQRASFFRSDRSDAAGRTIRTEVTVERQGTTVLLGNLAAAFDTCPICGSKLGSKLTPEPAEQARLRLAQGSISPGSTPADNSPHKFGTGREQ
jgi:hypothetical protein